MTLPMDRPRKRRSFGWRLKRLFLGAAVLLGVGLVTAGAVQSVYDRGVMLEYPPPGRLIDIGGRRLHLIVKGSGPTVVFESGAGGGAIDWTILQDRLAAVARVVCYDRAGDGWSDPANGPRSSSAIADDLHVLLQRAGIPPPYILVGHSLGGIYANAFAHRYAPEVAGLILLDSSHPDQMHRLSGFIPDLYYPAVVAAPFGIGRLVFRGGPPAGYPNALWAARTAVAGRSDHLRTLGYESHGLYAKSEATDLLRPLPRAIPLLVLTHSEPNPRLPADKAARDEQQWRQMQQELAALSPRGTQRVVPDSSHVFPFEQPETVVAAVTEILRQTASPD